jgi:hypothetical protein
MCVGNSYTSLLLLKPGRAYALVIGPLLPFILWFDELNMPELRKQVNP